MDGKGFTVAPPLAVQASRIFAIDTNPAKFPMAKELGATDCINPKELAKPVQQVTSP